MSAPPVLGAVGQDSLAVSAVGLLVALSVAVALLPARRALPERAATALAAPAPAARAARDLDVGLLLTEVATLLRAGADPARAWSRVLARIGLGEGSAPGPDGVPPALLALQEAPRPRWWPVRRGGRWRWEPPWPWRRAALRRRQTAAAAVPGAAAACRLTAALGAPLAEVLESVAGSVAESGRAEGSRAAALSGPRSTARLLACLPLVGLLLGSAVGARPLDLLADGAWGSGLAVAGIALMVLGQRLTGRLVAAAQGREGSVDEALVLDLAAAALNAGASVPGALTALGQALDEAELGVVGRALLLGSGWQESWAAPPGWEEGPGLPELEACLRPGWEDGAAPGPLLAAAAQALRASRHARDEEAAERLAVRLVVPLGLCYLPAFIIVGIIPVVASVGMDLLTG